MTVLQEPLVIDSDRHVRLRALSPAILMGDSCGLFDVRPGALLELEVQKLPSHPLTPSLTLSFGSTTGGHTPRRKS